jgi:hypothetical protein
MLGDVIEAQDWQSHAVHPDRRQPEGRDGREEGEEELVNGKILQTTTSLVIGAEFLVD